jgi:hypothetical protein
VTPIPQVTYEGAAGGMNAAISSHEIADNQAAYIQDILLNKPGILARRGPVKRVGTLTDSFPPQGIITSQDPQGNTRVALLGNEATAGRLRWMNSGLTAFGASHFLGFQIPENVIVDAKPMLNGGTLVGLSDTYELGGTQRLYIWRGGINDDYVTGTVSVTAGSKTVTGASTAWTSSNISAGMFLYDFTGGVLGRYLGCVASVDSGTQVTLEKPSPHTLTTSAYCLTALRGFSARVMTGTISTSSQSAVVSGSGTKFKSQGWDTTYRIYRASDNTLVGTVSSVSNDSGLTLAANAAVSMANERYYALSTTASTSPVITSRPTRETPGFISAIWDRRQWYGNLNQANQGTGDFTSRIWASDDADPEAVDFSTIDGDYIPVPSTKGTNTGIRALVPTLNSLLVLKDDEAHAVTGSYGAYTLNKIGDDGTLCGMSAAAWGGGAVWAGRTGVWMYDGLQAVNITENTLGDFYKAAIRDFGSNVDRAWAFVHRDHYIVHLQNATPPRGAIRGGSDTIHSDLTICIYLPTKAVSIFTNMNIRGSIHLPSSSGSGVWYTVRTGGAGGIVADANALFDDSSVDDTVCDNSSPGPCFYFESKRYSLGDGMLKKAWKWIALQYMSVGCTLKLDTLLGLNTNATTALSTFLPTTVTWFDIGRTFASWDELAAATPTWDDINSQVFQAHRIKFLKRHQYLAFRLYQPVAASGNDVGTDVKIGPWALAYKTLPGKL